MIYLLSKNEPETRRESTEIVNGKEFKVISVFMGDKTASELLYDLAVSRILNENIDETTASVI